ncbi:helix-turn-helix transcriptional regulator [Amycolatopsis albispora]|uniref:Helix-turn-helix domain-containing protein n=1 Tax=Amycolatopsis albispora TaxID=1804986 RepID=A0A344LBF7_9PSEU|nr:helix-turn-helix domain-containing protein [Amycolatopsis albispora]AXB45381.1 hypothetical protein A4R43_25210 [Amycolatopsis albispora]
MSTRTRLLTVEALWTPDDLAEFLGIPEKTLREWRTKNYGPRWVKMGKHVRYLPDAVQAWVSQLADSGMT